LKLGILGLIASTVGGALLGLLLAVPFAAIFMWLIIRKPSTAAAAGGGGAA
jgi:hypothetical protein